MLGVYVLDRGQHSDAEEEEATHQSQRPLPPPAQGQVHCRGGGGG